MIESIPALAYCNHHVDRSVAADRALEVLTAFPLQRDEWRYRFLHGALEGHDVVLRLLLLGAPGRHGR
jgi:hypothetical protein